MAKTTVGLICLVSLLASCSVQHLEMTQTKRAITKKDASTATSDTDNGKSRVENKSWWSSEKGVIAKRSFFDPNSSSGKFREIDPASEELLFRSIDAVRDGDWDRAQSNLERAIRLEPQDAYLWTQLAYVSYRRGNSNAAFVFTKKAAALSGDNASLSAEISSFFRKLEQ